MTALRLHLGRPEPPFATPKAAGQGPLVFVLLVPVDLIVFFGPKQAGNFLFGGVLLLQLKRL